MYRTTLIAAAAALGLSACTPATSGVSTIQADAKLICGFLPAITTIEALINLNSPTLQSATQIAQAICNAVTSKAKTLSGVPMHPSVHGVRIYGHFVR